MGTESPREPKLSGLLQSLEPAPVCHSSYESVSGKPPRPELVAVPNVEGKAGSKVWGPRDSCGFPHLLTLAPRPPPLCSKCFSG